MKPGEFRCSCCNLRRNIYEVNWKPWGSNRPGTDVRVCDTCDLLMKKNGYQTIELMIDELFRDWRDRP